MKRFSVLFAAFLVTLACFAGQGDYPWIIGTDHGARTSATINGILAQMNGRPGIIVLDNGIWDITEDVNIPSTVRLELPYRTILDISSTSTVTFVRQSQLVAPSRDSVFTGVGTVAGQTDAYYYSRDWEVGFTNGGGTWTLEFDRILDGSVVLHTNSVTRAELAWNSVGSPEIIDRSIQTNDIAEGGVDGYNILDRTIQTNDIAEGGVDGYNILDGSVGSNDIANSAIHTNHLSDGVIELIGTDQTLLNADYEQWRWGLPRITIAATAALWEAGVSNGATINTGIDVPSTMVDGDLDTATTGGYHSTGAGRHAYMYDFGEVLSGVVELVYTWDLSATIDAGEAEFYVGASFYPEYELNSPYSRNGIGTRVDAGDVAPGSPVTNSIITLFTGRYLTFGISNGGIQDTVPNPVSLEYEIVDVLVWGTNTAAYTALGGLE